MRKAGGALQNVLLVGSNERRARTLHTKLDGQARLLELLNPDEAAMSGILRTTTARGEASSPDCLSGQNATPLSPTGVRWDEPHGKLVDLSAFERDILP